MSFNPWHDVSPGEDLPGIAQAVIEIPKGSRAKYELDKESGMLRLDRVLYSAVYYPANYGFIPQTYGDDNDPLDILVLSQVDVTPLCLMRAKVIGVMRMVDNGEGDEKILAVCPDDVSVNHYNHIDDLPPYFHSELRHFFTEYKRLEKKTVLVEDFQGPKVAFDIIDRALLRYKEKFK